MNEQYIKNDYSEKIPTMEVDFSISIQFEKVLNDLVLQYGSEIFQKPDVIVQRMQECNVKMTEVYKLLTLIYVPGFYKLINSEQPTQVEICNFISMAYDCTGFMMPVIANLVAFVMNILGKAKKISVADMNPDTKSNFSYIVPFSMYKEDWDSLYIIFWSHNEAKKDESYYVKLTQLASMGVPKAQYILGMEQLNGDNKIGNNWIAKAAFAGDGDALKYFARLYYKCDDWKRSYETYNSVGINELTQEDKENLTSISKQKQFNKKMIGLSSIIFLIALCMLLFIPSFDIFSGSVVSGVGILAAMLMLCGGGIFLYKKNPYSKFAINFVVYLQCFIWMLYLICRIRF